MNATQTSSAHHIDQSKPWHPETLADIDRVDLTALPVFASTYPVGWVAMETFLYPPPIARELMRQFMLQRPGAGFAQTHHGFGIKAYVRKPNVG